MAPEKIETEVERIVRLETKLDYLIAQLDRLPPSPICVVHHSETNKKFIELEDEFGKRLSGLEAWRNRAIGAIMIIVIVFNVLVEKVLAFFGAK